jgi:hypothetical protein
LLNINIIRKKKEIVLNETAQEWSDPIQIMFHHTHHHHHQQQQISNNRRLNKRLAHST